MKGYVKVIWLFTKIENNLINYYYIDTDLNKHRSFKFGQSFIKAVGTANMDTYINNGGILAGKIKEPLKQNQLIVLKKSTLSDDKYVVINFFNKQLGLVKKQQILDNKDKYFNITISNNKIYIKYKLESVYNSGTLLEAYCEKAIYDTKVKMLGVENALGMLKFKVDDKHRIKCTGFSRGVTPANINTVKIPDFVHEIDAWAFNSSSIKKVILGKSVDKISYRAFSSSSIQEIKMNNRLKTIEGEAFRFCGNLKILDLSHTNVKIEVDNEYFINKLFCDNYNIHIITSKNNI